jgi:hypothetical protein
LAFRKTLTDLHDRLEGRNVDTFFGRPKTVRVVRVKGEPSAVLAKTLPRPPINFTVLPKVREIEVLLS